MRLDRILANSGIGSRTEVQSIIRQGRISLHGEILRSSKMQIPAADRQFILLDGKAINPSKHLYYLLNKPIGLITSMETGENNLKNILPDYFTNKKIMPVGRLDKDTSGLLLLTNNGELNHRLLAPKYEIPRIYYVEVEAIDHPFNLQDVKSLAAGLRLNDTETAKAAELEILSANTAHLTLYEGKYHEVRRLMRLLGKEVKVLHRLSYGNLSLNNESPGELRKLEPEEARALLLSVNLDTSEI